MNHLHDVAGPLAAMSPVGLGGWEAGGGRTWGDNTSDVEVISAIEAALDAGVTWFDTAEVYGGGGGSEEIFGKATSRRPDVLACTKAGPEPDGSGIRPDQLKPSIEASLRRLRRDVIDLYYVHWPDPSVPLLDTWEAMAGLVDDGLARSIGLSNFPLADVQACHMVRPVDAVQIQGSLLYLDEVREIGDWAVRNGVRTLCYGSLAYGLLTGTIAAETDLPDWRSGSYGMEDFFIEENHERFFALGRREAHLEVVEGLRPLAAAEGLELPQLALAALMARSEVDGVIAGTRSAEHAVQNAAAAQVTLKPSTIDQLSAIVPGWS